ncbi:MAG: protein rep [Melioribacteraceae bacterium]|nr:protein rep [Melioribacteraceae bacterium]MCF8265257.1 protein rep [Melioribacteraceae bacterium]MCF8412948.1 protein rep [Melioribacteraceae bacterium]
MKITELEKLKKRIRRKNDSYIIALDMLKKFNEVGLKDGRLKKKIERQLNCCSFLEVYSNDETRTWFCGQKTCRLCNSIRMAKLLGVYKEQVEKYQFNYHLSLTMENLYCKSEKDEHGVYSLNYKNEEMTISKRIDEMFKFWHNSMLCKLDIYKKLTKEVNFIRSWEVTFNRVNSVHPHFHLLLVSNNEDSIKTLGNLIIIYWIKWWERRKVRCVNEAQKLEPIRKTILENFKYCLKLSDIKNSNALKLIELLRATDSRRLFTQKGFMSESKLEDINKRNISDIEEVKRNVLESATKIHKLHYSNEIGGYYSESTGECYI